MRINKYLALCGLGSRRSVEALVKDGFVLINGNKITKLGCDVDLENDVVRYKGEVLKPLKYQYFAVYKPVGFVSTHSDEFAERKVVDLDPRLKGLGIVGRLDKGSEGLMLFTNDGSFNFKHQHPKNNCEKEYEVDVRSKDKTDLSPKLEKVLRYFTCGTLLDGYRTKPAKAKVIGKEGDIVRFNIVLKEGRKRQIREIFKKQNFFVVKLKRIRIGEYKICDLIPGQIMEINALTSQSK